MNLTQAALADQASVSKRTVERLESGAVATQLSGFLRVCRVLGLVEHFESWIPEATASPMEQLKHQAAKRRRASVKKAVAAKSENGHGVTSHDRGGATLRTDDRGGFSR